MLETTQVGGGSPGPLRASVSSIITSIRLSGTPGGLTAAVAIETVTPLLLRRLLSFFEDEPCLKTTSALKAATAGLRLFSLRPARCWAKWRRQETQRALPGKAGRKLHPGRRPPSGSNSTADVHLTTPCSCRPPPPLRLLLLSTSQPPSPPQRGSIRLAPLPTSLHLRRLDRGPTVCPQRGRKPQRCALGAAAAKLKPRSARMTTPRPIRIQLSFSNALSPWLRPVPCSPGRCLDLWLHPIQRDWTLHLQLKPPWAGELKILTFTSDQTKGLTKNTRFFFFYFNFKFV